MEKEQEQRPIKVSSYGGNEHSVEIKNFTEEELEKMLGCIQNGTCWIKVEGGRLVTVSSYEELPSPTEDEAMLPFWRKATKAEIQKGYTLFETEPIREVSFGSSISIQHLCGYNYSEEHYKLYAERLESYGFECLRSKRNLEGRYSEIWYLPCLFFAKGELKDSICLIDGDKKKIKAAVNFLSINVDFGTLDVSVQKLAAVFESE